MKKKIVISVRLRWYHCGDRPIGDAARASAGAGLLVRRQRHKTDKTRAVAILFLCSVRDGRPAVPQLSQASHTSSYFFIIF